jgi:hypothetical protein
MPQPQSFKNHTRFDPQFHFFLMPLMLLNVAFAIYATVHAWPLFAHRDLWWIVISLVLIIMLGRMRMYALQNQDRLIRLEEQLRLADLLPESELGLVEKLTIKQYVALRFASDGEAAALALRAAREGLEPKQIKEAIVNWRPDHHRI